ncbi:MAG: class I SAM-dependent methyltransferase [bacterium]
MNNKPQQLKREVADWMDYELLDSGNQEKCERFGGVTVVRPEPQALWSPVRPEVWASATARFEQRGDDGSWRVKSEPPESWSAEWNGLRFGLRLSSFKHTGVFPEQAVNWAFLQENLRPDAKLLNLFGYTGGATLAALSAGAEVVHVDASRPAIAAARRNAELSGLADRPARWIEDDAMKFVQREVRRERRYDAIVLDPPAFGRGPKGEIWRFETGLRPLLAECARLLDADGILIVNAYSLGFPALVVEQTVREAFPSAVEVESVELTLPERTERGFLLPAGITVRARV